MESCCFVIARSIKLSGDYGGCVSEKQLDAVIFSVPPPLSILPFCFVALRVFVAFMGHWGGTLAAFTAFVMFMGHWGWSLVTFTAFVLFMECLGWTFVAFKAFVAFTRRSGWSFSRRLECL